jgi:hypothetical protein
LFIIRQIMRAAFPSEHLFIIYSYAPAFYVLLLNPDLSWKSGIKPLLRYFRWAEPLEKHKAERYEKEIAFPPGGGIAIGPLADSLCF